MNMICYYLIGPILNGPKYARLFLSTALICTLGVHWKFVIFGQIMIEIFCTALIMDARGVSVQIRAVKNKADKEYYLILLQYLL